MDISIQRALELDVTYFCNLGCKQCNRALGLFPSNDMMTIEQVNKILHESALMEQPYTEIRVLGGEPTLHPHLFEIVKILDWYRHQVSNCKTSLWTHGQGELIKQKLKKLPTWLQIRVTPKVPKLGGENFEAFLAAPVDYKQLHTEDYRNGCGQIVAGKCGIGVSMYGIYVCPIAAAIDRIVGLDIGLKTLKEVSSTNFREQCNQLCRYCGHFLVDRGIEVSIETVSETWRELRKTFRTRIPQLTYY